MTTLIESNIPFVDLLDVHEVFASHTRQTHFDGHSIHVELAFARPIPAGPAKATPTLYPAARLVLSPFAAVVLHEQLGMMIPMIEKQGLVKRVAPSTDKPQ